MCFLFTQAIPFIEDVQIQHTIKDWKTSSSARHKLKHKQVAALEFHYTTDKKTGKEDKSQALYVENPNDILLIDQETK